MTQYLESRELIKFSGIDEIKISDLGKVDSYDETKIKNKITGYRKDGIILLLKASIQMAIVGFGNKSFGFIRHNDSKIELSDIFAKYNVKTNNHLKDKLEDDDLTPRRLIRFFRFQIKKFIDKNKISSYLWNKYAPKNFSEEFKQICFPGAEHLIDNEEDAAFLIKTYEELDSRMNTTITDRIKRVFDARSVRYYTLSPNRSIERSKGEDD